MVGATTGFMQRLKLRTFVLILSMVCIATAGGVSAYISFSNLYENKLSDTWTILFLELEQKVSYFSRQMQHATSYTIQDKALAFSQEPEALVKLSEDQKSLTRILGVFSDSVEVEKPWTEELTKARGSVTILSLGGLKYVFKSISPRIASLYLKKKVEKGSYFFVWPFNGKVWLNVSSSDQSDLVVYGANNLGQLVFRNSDAISEDGFGHRALVKKFISDPFTKGETEFVDQAGASWFGFYAKVPGVNLVVFQEVSKAFAFESMIGGLTNFAFVFFGMLAAAALLLYVALDRFVLPLRKMTDVLVRKRGESVTLSDLPASFGEVALLGRAVEQYAHELVREDDTGSILSKEVEKWLFWPTPMKLLLPQRAMPPISQIESSFEVLGKIETERYFYQFQVFPKRHETWFMVSQLSFAGPSAFMFQTSLKCYFDSYTKAGGNTIEGFFSGLGEAMEPWLGFDPNLKILIGYYKTSRDGDATLSFASKGFANVLIADEGAAPNKMVEGTELNWMRLSEAPQIKVHRGKVTKTTSIVLFDHCLFVEETEEQKKLSKNISKLLKSYKVDSIGEFSTLIRGYLDETLSEEAAEHAHLLMAMKILP